MKSKLSDPPIFFSQFDMLRQLVNAFNNCRECSIDSLTIPELINIYHCWMRCGWNIYPDEWADKQIKEAKKGICPEWDERERPVYDKDRRKTRKIVAITIKEKSRAND